MTARHPISDQNVALGIWNFDIICNLSIVFWDFSGVSRKANLLYLNHLELTLTLPWLILGMLYKAKKKKYLS
jgi:hypothetical protein